MIFSRIKSHAKLNLALNITGKTSSLHKIESVIGFTSFHDDIFIKKIKSETHDISFFGKFSKNIGKNNTISKLLKILEKKKFLQNTKFKIKINKKIPIKAGLGGGSMNAASILNYFIKRKIIKINKRGISEICNLVGSDVILGLSPTNSILTSKNEIKCFKDSKKFQILIVKPNFGCSTKNVYSKVKTYNKSIFNKSDKKLFESNFLKKLNNDLEPIVFSKYPELKKIKLFLESLANPAFVRMTGSGSALVAYYQSKKRLEYAKIKFRKNYKNYWCIASKTI